MIPAVADLRSLPGVAAVRPTTGGPFGATVEIVDAMAFLAGAGQTPRALSEALNASDGLLLLRGLDAISDDPGLLLGLSRLFGREVENYRLTGSDDDLLHPDIPELLVLTNRPPVNRRPPARPEPPTLADGGLPVQFPQRRGWHTDQSFRRPPPDMSLFYAVLPAPVGQGQTLYADGCAAWDALPARLKARVEELVGIHAKPFSGRAEYDVRAGCPPLPLGPHQQPQRQPVVRVHPETGRKSLYLCEAGQMDWIDGPFVGMEPGIEGDGARLLYELMTHYTGPSFAYAHEWLAGDLVVYDNRCTIHCATWYDADRHDRVMWRTTVWGNPGAAYEGERRSWEAKSGELLI